MAKPAAADGAVLLVPEDLQALIDVLRQRGHTVLGPTVREGAIVHAEVRSVSDLPLGWTSRHDPGSYRLEKRRDGALFGYVVGPGSWKEIFHPAELRLLSASREGRDFRLDGEDDGPQPRKKALIGVRSCDLHAISIQDKIFLEGPYRDPGYARRREGTFVVAVNCTEPAATCFCASMGTGPEATSGFDLSLTELVDSQRHVILARAGTSRGAKILAALPGTPASEDDARAARSALDAAAGRMGRTLRTENLKEDLYARLEHPEWDRVAERCLACTNCTLVCPTCFCTTVEDVTDLSGKRAERIRKWDSCFTREFSYIYGGHVRRTIRSRYRQWLTHKLATWQDQFGMIGCVGCGRCIAWCPVGIDIVEEVRCLRGESA